MSKYETKDFVLSVRVSEKIYEKLMWYTYATQKSKSGCIQYILENYFKDFDVSSDDSYLMEKVVAAHIKAAETLTTTAADSNSAALSPEAPPALGVRQMLENDLVMKFVSFAITYCLVSGSKLSESEQSVVQEQAAEFRKAIREMI